MFNFTACSEQAAWHATARHLTIKVEILKDRDMTWTKILRDLNLQLLLDFKYHHLATQCCKCNTVKDCYCHYSDTCFYLYLFSILEKTIWIEPRTIWILNLYANHQGQHWCLQALYAKGSGSQPTIPISSENKTQKNMSAQ